MTAFNPLRKSTTIDDGQVVISEKLEILAHSLYCLNPKMYIFVQNLYFQSCGKYSKLHQVNLVLHSL